MYAFTLRRFSKEFKTPLTPERFRFASSEVLNFIFRRMGQRSDKITYTYIEYLAFNNVNLN